MILAIFFSVLTIISMAMSVLLGPLATCCDADGCHARRVEPKTFFAGIVFLILTIMALRLEGGLT